MNYQETKEYLKRYLKARIPVILLNTVEKNRALRMFKDITNETNYNFSLYVNRYGDVLSGTPGRRTYCYIVFHM